MREWLIRTDPIGIVEGRSHTVVRRKYKVPGPLSLWCINGHNELIRASLGDDGVL